MVPLLAFAACWITGCACAGELVRTARSRGRPDPAVQESLANAQELLAAHPPRLFRPATIDLRLTGPVAIDLRAHAENVRATLARRG